LHKTYERVAAAVAPPNHARCGEGLSPTTSRPVGLPPLAEQRRIVANVDELMALCDRLEANLTAGDDTRRRLDALLHEAEDWVDFVPHMAHRAV
jgi:hypothetical protein